MTANNETEYILLHIFVFVFTFEIIGIGVFQNKNMKLWYEKNAYL